jgi:hypothetical protein
VNGHFVIVLGENSNQRSYSAKKEIDIDAKTEEKRNTLALAYLLDGDWRHLQVDAFLAHFAQQLNTVRSFLGVTVLPGVEQTVVIAWILGECQIFVGFGRRENSFQRSTSG